LRQAIAATCALILCSSNGLAQNVGDSIQLGDSCSYFGEAMPKSVTAFASTTEAKQVIQRIVEASGLAQNFEIAAAGVPNAAATMRGSTRLILYSPFFISELSEKTGNRWAPISVMAHEVAHHLNGHTLTQTGSQPKLELESDFFSGFVLQRMGAKIGDAKAAMERLGSPIASSTHPAKHDRLAAIGAGWAKACDTDSSCRNASSTAPDRDAGKRDHEETRRRRTDLPPKPKKGAPDSCEYAKDGTCDEPDLCDKGTDTTDCRQARIPAPPNQPPVQVPYPQQTGQMAMICQTPSMWCRMMVPMMRGFSCTCYTPFGPIPGIAQ